MNSKILTAVTLAMLLINGCSSTSSSDQRNLKGTVLMKDAKPFNGTKIVQIGIVVSDVDKSAQSYAKFFGVDVPKSFVSETADTAKTQYRGKPTTARVKQAFFHFENISIELLEPVGGPSTWQEFLDDNGPGVHHIAFKVKDIDSRIKEMEDRGVELIQQGRWTDYSGGRYAYFDSDPQLAVILELLENF